MVQNKCSDRYSKKRKSREGKKLKAGIMLGIVVILGHKAGFEVLKNFNQNLIGNDSNMTFLKGMHTHWLPRN
jgi:hypothetical protein